MTEPGHEERSRPRLPLWIAVLSIVLALISASILVYVLYKETKGPGEILREFARRIDRNDCAGSYDLLSEGVRAGFSGDRWCSQTVLALDELLDADFTVERAVLEGDTAEVKISGVELTDWRLSRYGQRSWRVLGPSEGFPVDVEVPASGEVEIEGTPIA
jgi:hypothetical protein